jgi:diguanylate cyclase (GGDEF)-like protein
MPTRSILLLLWCLLLAQSWPATARAETIRLRANLCYATAPAGYPTDAASVAALQFDCAKTPDGSAYRKGWVWLKVRDPSAIGAMPPGWQLLNDQARFTRLVVQAVATDGTSQATTIAPGAIGNHWALGGTMRFSIDRPGAEIRDIYLGFRELSDLSLMRKVTAASPRSALWLDGIWLGLMGVFAGAIASAFAYNLLIYTGQRLVFQRWYLVWSSFAFAYGLSWTNVLTYALPDFVGPVAVQVDYLLVSGMIAAGNIFFLSVIEEGLLPRWLIRSGWVCAGIDLLMGLIAASGWFATPIIIDRWLNVGFLLSALCIATGITIAIRARSRVVWFYLAGWTPIIIVFAMRVARNFDLLAQDDMVDMSTFAALAFESVALSLAIADRFRLLGKERDAAEQARQVIEIESDMLRRAAQTDFLTGLGNRAAFQTTLRSLCESPEGQPFTLLLIDVDHLKNINDRLGHDGGDVLLENVGHGLAVAAGDKAHVSRIGGDEFAILLPSDETEQQSILESLESLQGKAFSYAGRAWALSLSIGFARFPQDADSADLLVKNADLALYQAKLLGRRQLQIYDPSLRAKLDSRQVFSQEAYQGLDRDEFSLHFQPIVDLHDGLPTSYEALLRWQHPVHGLMTPGIFGDMLGDRKIGLMVQQHVMELGLGALRDHPEQLPRLSLNVTAAQLDGANAATRLLMRLEQYGIAPQRLCIEVTEDIVLNRTINETVKALGLLHDAGVKVALDDFGTGYASLIHLKHLPFDMLKIDRSFTLSLFEDDGQSEEIIRAIIGLGHGLRKQVVAEGVETEAQCQRLIEMGCQLGQGYLFARPEPIEVLAPVAFAPGAAA